MKAVLFSTMFVVAFSAVAHADSARCPKGIIAKDECLSSKGEIVQVTASVITAVANFEFCAWTQQDKDNANNLEIEKSCQVALPQEGAEQK